MSDALFDNPPQDLPPFGHHWVNGTCHCGATQTTWDAWVTDEQTNRRGQGQ